MHDGLFAFRIGRAMLGGASVSRCSAVQRPSDEIGYTEGIHSDWDGDNVVLMNLTNIALVPAYMCCSIDFFCLCTCD